MVGIPGRSKGCHACRKQKIACSLERPECLRCSKAGRTCPGYRRDHTFVNLTLAKNEINVANRQHYVAPSKQHSLSKEPLKEPCVNERELERIVASPKYPQPTTLVPQQSLVLGAYRHQLLGIFLSRYGPQKGREQSLGQSHWLITVPSRPVLSSALDVAATAFCTAKLGRTANDSRIVTESLSLYGRGLQELQRALYDPSQMYSDDTLGACILLAMYEVFKCPNRSHKGYLSHMRGCGQLIYLRGPEAHASGLGHRIFNSFRFIATLDALDTRQTFLDDPAWMTVPFIHAPKSPINRLLDIILKAPALQRRADTLPSIISPDEQLQSAFGVIRACKDLEIQLSIFYGELTSHVPAVSLFWETPAEDDSLKTHLLFPTIYRFQDVHVASTLTLHWALLSLLRNGILQLSLFIKEVRSKIGADAAVADAVGIPAVGDDLARLSADLQGLSTPARQVCMAVPFCLAQQDTDLGLTAVAAPLHIVFETFRAWGDVYASECVWVRGMLQTVRKRGLGMVEFLEGMRS